MVKMEFAGKGVGGGRRQIRNTTAVYRLCMRRFAEQTFMTHGRLWEGRQQKLASIITAVTITMAMVSSLIYLESCHDSPNSPKPPQSTTMMV